MSNITLDTTGQSGLRTTFFGKVMIFFALAVFSSALGTYITYTYFVGYFFTMPWLIYLVFAAELILVFTAHWWSTAHPLNRLLFALFTFLTGVTFTPILAVLAASPAGIGILTKALLSTGFMFTATALIGWTTKYDLSGLRGFLVMSLIGMIIVSLIGIFLPWGNTFELLFSGFGVILFSGYTMYDFQRIKSYPEDRYIDAALRLYLDIFNLFLYILRLLMALNRR